MNDADAPGGETPIPVRPLNDCYPAVCYRSEHMNPSADVNGFVVQKAVASR